MWNGKVANEDEHNDQETVALRNIAQRIAKDDRVDMCVMSMCCKLQITLTLDCISLEQLFICWVDLSITNSTSNPESDVEPRRQMVDVMCTSSNY